LAIEQPKLVLMKNQVGIGVIVTLKLRCRHKRVPPMVGYQPKNAVITHKNLRVLKAVVLVRVGRTDHPIGPVLLPESSRDKENVGVTSLS
jgi:hypothetical protein